MIFLNLCNMLQIFEYLEDVDIYIYICEGQIRLYINMWLNKIKSFFFLYWSKRSTKSILKEHTIAIQLQEKIRKELEEKIKELQMQYVDQYKENVENWNKQMKEGYEKMRSWVNDMMYKVK